MKYPAAKGEGFKHRAYLRTGIFNGPGSIRRLLEAGAAMVLFVVICVGGYFLGWGLQ